MDLPAADDERLDRAYADSAKLRDRVDLYRWQQPRFDLHTVAPAYATYRPGDRVLDVGCGPWEALLRLAAGPDALTLVGVDRSAGMIGEASGRPDAERVQWAVSDVVRPTADFYDLPGGWDPVVAHVEQAVRAHLARDGAFRILTAVDVYVCR